MKRRLFAILMSAVMIVTFMPAAAFADDTNSNGTIYTAKYYDSLTETAQKTQFVYSDELFNSASTEFDNQLAIASLSLDLAAGHNTDDNIKAVLGEMGFEKFDSNYNTKVEKKDNVCVAYAMKEVGDMVIVPAIVRGSFYENEWIDNFCAGTEGDAAGYKTAADRVVGYIDSYVAAKNIDPAKIKLWVVGFSRGGAIADLACKQFNKTYGAEHVYGYCFESPMTNVEDVQLDNVHHTRNVNDGVTCVLPDYMDWSLAGTVDNSIGIGDQTAMKAQLADITSDYASYIMPDGFRYAYIEGQNLNDYIVSTLPEGKELVTTGDVADLSEFWPVVLDKLKVIIPTREVYTSEYSELTKATAKTLGVDSYTVEQSAMKIVDYVFSLDDAAIAQIEDNLDVFMADVKAHPTSYMYEVLMLGCVVHPTLEYDFSNSLCKTGYKILVEDISKILGGGAEMKAAINGVLQPVLIFIDKDIQDQEHQVIGTLLYNDEAGDNLHRIAYQHSPELTLAWLRAVVPLNTTSAGNASGTQAKEIKATATKVTKLKASKKSITVKWARKNAAGYKIQYSTDKKFKKARKVEVSSMTTSKTIKKLKRHKRYYVRVRTYVNGKNGKKWSKWSKVKSIKTK